MTIREKMLAELEEKNIFDQARNYAFEYMDGIEQMDVFPSEESLAHLVHFDEKIANESTAGGDVLKQLHQYGTPATTAQAGGRYFGFVNGNAVPAALGAKWLSDVWDQNGGMSLASPINAKLEAVCEHWLKDVFKLPSATVAGFVSGTSMANLCGLAAARYQLLKNAGWDINEDGLNGAPAIRIIAHEQVHASVRKTLALLGFGKNSVEWIPSDEQGRIVVAQLPKLDHTCLVLLQAGNVNTGAYDDFDDICNQANKVGAWVHIDGAFGLWAAACKSLAHLTKGMEKASSWAVDGHKTLNTPYDSGIIMCRHPQAMVTALQASGAYLNYTDQREPILYGPEMSKRSRAIELWATMKYLGKAGIDEMITGFHLRAKQLAEGLRQIDFHILNEVVFNQVLISCDTDEETQKVLAYAQQSGECWMGGTTWQGKAAIRISICSWRTSAADIEQTIAVLKRGKDAILGSCDSWARRKKKY